ncbi:regulatory protein RecX [Paenibacillus apiarius]|uniref:Regulatory protein RecX n=1 Tax=Paenibacillus apiarius TaxID=46240 RepID=A0ABT4DQQ7_9BACL|nr:RecX family transcriptional regulator [Paenibacillus apiarius]MCY9516098.1 RecX family transcriptional regulator [Paenibacillus apiarius]MCY9518443.1 RecX family transcriptional regulator [Paenibacillus apiarius]MCY9551156.1 RecX family transcriptional regulator [Paenibacillus apiarius]MCY9558310.1 RecX family transcriptional regulator [Paenibacillus apiarius]MCY9684710.1 RecX family transcriptional regulator [Paenibacillus apiarius]
MSEKERIVSIVRVERDEKQAGRYIIHLDQASPLNVHEEVMIKYRLLKGTELSLDSLDEILRADEGNRAYVQSIKYLQRKPRTRMELARNLAQKGYEEGIIQEVLDRLEREWLVDDQAYAHQWTNQRVTRHMKGRRWIQHELKQKGIPERHISSAIDAIEPEQEWESAMQAAHKKWRQIKGEPHLRKQKVAAFLARRGYPMDIARRAAYQAADEQETENGELGGEDGK